MRITLIGSRGQLGTACRLVLGNSHEIVCCDRPQLDLGDRENVERCIAALRPEVIINCAAYTAVDACETDTAICRRINTDGPGFLARAASRCGCRLIHISTDYVFDGLRPAPAGYQEEDRTNPLSSYGRTKREGEEAVLHAGGNVAILRTAWLYSAHGANFLKTMLRLCLQDRHRTIKVVNDQHGSLTWVNTLARQIGQLLGPELQGIYHATANGHSTWFEAADVFLNAMGVDHKLAPCTTSEYPTAATRPANSILCNSSLEAAGLSVFRDWRDDLDQFVQCHGRQLLRELTTR
ncbi:MAG: dTDP-4-dehydrorhamnose reductase [Desulfopila sp.]